LLLAFIVRADGGDEKVLNGLRGILPLTDRLFFPGIFVCAQNDE
jgi:hypothetical protein